MQKITLGSTGIKVNKNGFGALPIQRVSFDEAKTLLRKAYDNGIQYFDTARMYTDSEEKIGYALADVRKHIYIATKSMAVTPEALKKDIDTSLSMLKTDYIDVFQLHNPPFVSLPGDERGLFEVLEEAKEQGKIRHIGFTNHRLNIAKEAVLSGCYEVLQFPFSYLASDEEKELVSLCKEKNVGFVCMKGMAGGLISSGRAAYAYMAEFKNALPIWGVQKEEELDEFISCNTEGFEQRLTPDLQAIIEEDKKAFTGNFCRGCGYCMPCPVGIEINNCARMTLMLGRSRIEDYTTEAWKEKMHKIEECVHCGQCASKCPYSLDTPHLLEQNYEDYKPYF